MSSDKHPETEPRAGGWVDREITAASICALAGLVCLLLFLVKGFGAITMGLGMFVGLPLVLAGIVFYLVALVADLRRRGAL